MQRGLRHTVRAGAGPSGAHLTRDLLGLIFQLQPLSSAVASSASTFAEQLASRRRISSDLAHRAAGRPRVLQLRPLAAQFLHFRGQRRERMLLREREAPLGRVFARRRGGFLFFLARRREAAPLDCTPSPRCATMSE